MHRSNLVRRILVGSATAAALFALTVGATACTSTSSAAPTTTPMAPAGSTSPAPATSHLTPSAASPATSAQPAPAAGPTAATGQAVIKQNCLGQCHQNQLLGYRTSASSAQRIASSMGRRVNLNSADQQAVALFFAQ